MKERQDWADTSKERIVDELNKILLSPKPSIGLKALENTGLLEDFFPELQNLKGVDKKDGKKPQAKKIQKDLKELISGNVKVKLSKAGQEQNIVDVGDLSRAFII